MTNDEAFQTVTRLCALGTWDDAIVQVWIDELATCADVEAAQRATHAVLRTWQNPGRPTIAFWLDAYRAELRNSANTRNALPENRRTMPLSEYLTIMRARAAQGDRDAARIVGNFERLGGAFLTDQAGAA